ncbi:MAG: hypothetical protein ABI600_06115 [Luteolibacter sp.]
MNTHINNPYAVGMVSESPESARAEFIRKTYAHLAGAVALFVVLEWAFLRMGLGETALGLLGASKYSWLMVIFASSSILYNTSNLIHRYQPGQHVAASLSLFASIALLFWYVLRLLMSLNRN